MSSSGEQRLRMLEAARAQLEARRWRGWPLRLPSSPMFSASVSQKTLQNFLLTILGQAGFTGDFIALSLWHGLTALL